MGLFPDYLITHLEKVNDLAKLSKGVSQSDLAKLQGWQNNTALDELRNE